MATVLTVTANTLVDFLGPCTVLPGKVNRLARLEPIAGGKGLNVARVLARHGHRVVAAGFAGGFSGALLRELVERDGLVPALAPTRARTRIGVQAIMPGGGSTAILEDGFAVEPEELEALLAQLEPWLGESALVVVAGSVPDPRCVGLFARLLESCARAEVPCWIDSYGQAMAAALASPQPPALAKPNRQEFEGSGAFARCPEVHLTDGGGAVEVRAPQGSFRVEPPAIAEVNAVGSGDCYVAALAHARLSGLGFEDQLCYAAAAGAANAARADVAAIGPDEIAPLVSKVRCTRL